MFIGFFSAFIFSVLNRLNLNVTREQEELHDPDFKSSTEKSVIALARKLKYQKHKTIIIKIPVWTNYSSSVDIPTLL